MTLLLSLFTGNQDASNASMVPAPAKKPAKRQKASSSVTPSNANSAMLENNNSKENTIPMQCQTETVERC
jgi:hypothetical protein